MPDKPPAPSDLADKFMLRLPTGMRDALRDAAAANQRSMNAEIVARLLDTFSAEFAGTLEHKTSVEMVLYERLILIEDMLVSLGAKRPDEKPHGLDPK